MADSDKVEVGGLVLAIGNPFGSGETVTMGMVSAKGRAPLGLDYEDFIQTDAAINPGNSGGALIDLNGRLIGINTAILSRSGGNQGIGFAVPSDLAREVMDGLVTHGHVIRGYLGVRIQDVTPGLAKAFKLKEISGALVSDVSTHSPASKAGIADGDVIVEFHGKKVADSRPLKLMVAETQPGDTVPVKILRHDDARTLQVKVGEIPGEASAIQASNNTSEDTDTLKGVSVVDLDADIRQQYEVPDEIHSALITGVEEDSAAARAGLKPGDDRQFRKYFVNGIDQSHSRQKRHTQVRDDEIKGFFPTGQDVNGIRRFDRAGHGRAFAAQHFVERAQHRRVIVYDKN